VGVTVAERCAALIPGAWTKSRLDPYAPEAWLKTDRHTLCVLRRGGGWVAGFSVALDDERVRAWSADRDDIAGALTAVRDLVVGAGEVWPW